MKHPWSYRTMLPAETVMQVGWEPVLHEHHEMAKVAARGQGIYPESLGEPVDITVSSWVLGEDGSYVPHPADGNEQYFGIRLAYDVEVP